MDRNSYFVVAEREVPLSMQLQTQKTLLKGRLAYNETKLLSNCSDVKVICLHEYTISSLYMLFLL